MGFRKPWIFALAVALGSCAPRAVPGQVEETDASRGDATAADLEVRVDPRIELLSIVFRLAGNPEYNQGQVPAYDRAIEARFGSFEDHPAVALARRLGEDRGIGFDAVMNLAVHIDDAFDPGLPLPAEDLDAPLYDDGRWTPETAERFVEALGSFVEDTDFRSFWEVRRELYAAAEQSAHRLAAADLRPGWFTAFFGRGIEVPFTLVAALGNGGANYGVRFRDARGREHRYAVIGVSAVDEEGLPVLRSGQLPTVIHEFSHSFVNPATAAFDEELERSATAYEPVQESMGRQAYGDWHTVVNESLVRGSVVRYLRAQAGPEAAEAELSRQVDRGFLWIRELDSLLGTYEDNRERWPTFDAFVPRAVEYFDGLADRIEGMVAERDAEIEREQRALDPRRPRLVSVEPADGREDVDPTTEAIVLTFDRPMTGGYQMNPGAGGIFPETTDLSWNDDRTVLTIGVHLEPATDYSLLLNTRTGGAFRSASESVPLRMTEIRFRTRGS